MFHKEELKEKNNLIFIKSTIFETLALTRLSLTKISLSLASRRVKLNLQCFRMHAAQMIVETI